MGVGRICFVAGVGKRCMCRMEFEDWIFFSATWRDVEEGWRYSAKKWEMGCAYHSQTRSSMGLHLRLHGQISTYMYPPYRHRIHSHAASRCSQTRPINIKTCILCTKKSTHRSPTQPSLLQNSKLSPSHPNLQKKGHLQKS